MPIHLSEKPDIEIFSSAYDKLIKFSNEIKINEQETGGVLIGKRIHNSIVIFEVTGPGTNARHSSDSFSPDIKDAQKILNNSRKNFDVFNIGSWHTHRNAFDQLSMGDIRQMQEIVEDKDLLNEMICFIICFKQKLELHVFHMNNERKIVKLNYRILSLNDELLYSHDLVKAGEVVPCKFDIGFDEKSYIDLYKFKKYYDFKKLPFSFYLFNFK
jgi:integrative and conjugative element protein (TIGR02256 family)